MADEVDDLGESVENLANSVAAVPELKLNVPEPNTLDGLIEKFKELTGAVFGTNKEIINMLPATDQVEKSGSDMGISVAQSIGSTAKSAEKAVGTLDKLKGSLTDMGDEIRKKFMDAMPTGFTKEISRAQESIGKLVGPGTALGLQTGLSLGLEQLEKSTGVFDKIQKPLLAVEKAAMQMQLGMGTSFDSAVKNVGAFRNEFTNSMVDTKSTLDAVTKTQDAFRGAFRADEVIRHLNSLEKATGRVRASTTLTNAALLVGVAKGVDSAKIADIMSKAHLELGASAEEAATALGDISIASEKSGLNFDKSADAIVSNAQKLAMWGGTIKSVAPLLQAFTSALGDNRKGLAPQLLNEYVSGLERMGFEMRALTGITTGVGGGRGALGAGLEMEALLDKGAEGMEEVSQRLIDTVKQFSGGQMITREEAIADPALEQNFIIQRKLLQQMVGGSDASATKMLGILKQIDENGLKTGSDAESKLGELMGQGQRMQDKTTDTLSEQIIKQTATQIESGDKIVREISNLASTLQQYLGAGKRVSEQAAKTGTLRVQDIRTAGKMSGNEKLTNKTLDSVLDTLGISKSGSKREDVKNRLEVESGVEVGRKKSNEITDVLVKDLLKLPSATKSTAPDSKAEKPSGKIPMETAKSIIDTAVKELAGEIEKVSGGQHISKLDNIKKAEVKVLEERLEQLQSLSKEKFILPEHLGVKNFNKEPRDSVKKEQRPGATVAEVKIEQASKKEKPEDLVRKKVNAASASEAPRSVIEQAPQTLNRPTINSRDLNTVESAVSHTPEKIVQDVFFKIHASQDGDGVVVKVDIDQAQFDKKIVNSTTLPEKIVKAIRRENTKT